MTEDHNARTLHGRIAVSGIVWFVRLYLLACAIGILVSPALITYTFGGVEWAALVFIATVGVGAFLAKFLPWLIARWLARAIAKDVERAAEDLNGEIND